MEEHVDHDEDGRRWSGADPHSARAYDVNASKTAPYTRAFYEGQLDGSLRSARLVLELLYKHFQPRSVIDVGCGQGCWLLAAGELGSSRLKGLDGAWVRQPGLLSPDIDFTPVDFTATLPIGERYDLCISLEVAEHLPPASAHDFVDALCRASDIVLFSAAVKDQGGLSHLNEQWQSYWIALFDERGYQCVDGIRGKLWANSAIDVWYRQNTFLFVNRSSDMSAFQRLGGPPVIVDVVHPEQYESRMRKYYNDPSLRFCLESFARYARNKARRVGILKG